MHQQINRFCCLCRKMSKIDIGINVIENEGIKHGIKINLPLIFNFLYLTNVNISFKLFQNYIFILYYTSLFSFIYIILIKNIYVYLITKHSFVICMQGIENIFYLKNSLVMYLKYLCINRFKCK